MRIRRKLAELTGISSAYYLAHDLRITKEQFRVELLRQQNRVLGRYDARLERALVAVEGGDDRYLAHPTVDSYHGVWFELHDELIALAGSDRSAEIEAGRA